MRAEITSDRERLELIIILGILTALAPLSIDMYLPSFPSLELFFHTDARNVQLTLTSFFIAFSFGQLVYGPLSDRFGRKILLYFGLTIFIFSSLIAAFATTIEMLIVTRFFQALGASAGVVIARAIVSDMFHTTEAAKIYSAMILVMGAAPILAPIAGGFLQTSVGWESIFGVLMLFGIVAITLIYFRLRESHGIHEEVTLSFRAIFGRYKALLFNRRFIGYTLSSGMAMSMMFAYIVSSPFIFIDHFGIPTEHFGWFFGMNAFGFIIFSQINGRLLKYKSPLEIVKIAILFEVGMSLIFLLEAYFSGELYSILIPLFFSIALLGFLVPNMTALAMANFTTNAGSASAFLGSVQFMISGVTSAVVGALHSDDPLLLSGVVLACSVSSCLLFIFLAKR